MIKNKIPKIIHYCWFGNTSKSELALKCIESWKKHATDFQIVEWNESNYDVTKNRYMFQAYQNGMYAFVSDYARLDIIYKNGGIYLDVDVEMIKPIDELLDNEVFFGCDDDKYVATGLGFGAVKNNNHIKNIMSLYDNIDFVDKNNNFDTTSCPYRQTPYFENLGFKISNTIQKIDNITIYPKDYFCPKNSNTHKINVTNNTLLIHHFDGSWLMKEERILNLIFNKHPILANNFLLSKAIRFIIKSYYSGMITTIKNHNNIINNNEGEK